MLLKGNFDPPRSGERVRVCPGECGFCNRARSLAAPTRTTAFPVVIYVALSPCWLKAPSGKKHFQGKKCIFRKKHFFFHKMIQRLSPPRGMRCTHERLELLKSGAIDSNRALSLDCMEDAAPRRVLLLRLWYGLLLGKQECGRATLREILTQGDQYFLEFFLGRFR